MREIEERTEAITNNFYVGKLFGMEVSSNIVHFKARYKVVYLKTVFVPIRWCPRVTVNLPTRYNKT